MRPILTLALLASAAFAQTRVPTPADQVAAAVLPLPEALRGGAGVRGYDESMRLVTLRETTNGMICTGDRPGDAEFDVRCYERSFLRAIDRRRELGASGGTGTLSSPDPRFEEEVKSGKLPLPSYPTAGYRMLGPIGGYDPATRAWTEEIERWQSVHFPFRTAAEIGLPTEREGTTPFVMASGTWWSHVMIVHTAPPAGETAATGGPRLGSLVFPNSGAPAAQPAFRRGMLYLHSFEYGSAATAFQEAQRVDPGFALAYWGEALTHTHPIWNEQDLAQARAVLARLGPTPEARLAKASTPREKAYLEAIERLYGAGGKEHRDTLFAEAMSRVAAAYPNDDEARAFHALSLMGLSQGVRDVATYMRAGAIALELLQRQPDHPGAAHYVIHAFDDPVHAAIGLPAARAYSAIAPGAAHAQHMTTHIFLALGMWPDVISQNRIASGPDRARWQAGHYTYWLHYGLMQAGHGDSAVALLDELRRNAGQGADLNRRAHLASARAQQIVNAERWNDPALAWTIDLEDADPTMRAVDLFARGYAATRRGDLETAGAVHALAAALETGPGLLQVPALLTKQLGAAIDRAAGRKADAERALRDVAAASEGLPMAFGPPDFVKPPFEMLGEWLLEDGRPDAAREAFRRALGHMPGRRLSIRGLGQAEQRLATQ
ncbi:MAG: hypothetical protein ACKVZ0_18660 [Gemmatimonadales bacterium]